MKLMCQITKWILPLMAAGLLPWLAGCESVQNATLTGHMWEATRNNREPASKPNLTLYQTASRDDVLVRYDEELQSNGAVRSRAFLLFANEKKLKAGRKPAFLSAENSARLQSVPIKIILESDTKAMAGEDLQAFILPDGQHFTLVSKGRYVGSFCLPTYGTVSTGGKVARALLLPAVVAGDATLYAGVLGCYVAPEVLGNLAQNSTASHSDRIRGK